MARFAFATVLAVVLLTLAALFGGGLAWLALAYLTVIAAGLDGWPLEVTPRDDAATIRAADRLSVALALAQFPLLWLVLDALAQGTGPERVALFAAMGIFMGQIGNSNAHELIHRSGRGLRRLGIAVYVSHLFGHHASAHPLVHHIHVATDRDPNSARLGRSYYRFALEAWRGSFQQGLKAESARMARAGRPGIRHPYVVYILGALAMLLVVGISFGPIGVLRYIALAGFATSQLLMSDYVQHYGLRRQMRPNGKAEPVSILHSWNSPHWFTSALMLNAPRHSDHHADPARPYPALRLPDAAPTLPYALPVMAMIALWPPLWRQIMDPRVKEVTQ